MKRSLALIVTLASGFVLSAAAQTPAATAAAPGPAKIAVIAFQVAVAQTNEGQRNFADLQKKFDPRRQQLKVLSDEMEAATKEMQDVYNALASKVYDVMQSYAELKGYTLVLDVSQQQSPVLYASTSTNITKDIIDAYNVKSGIPAPPAQPASGVDAPKPTPRTGPRQPAAPATH